MMRYILVLVLFGFGFNQVQAQEKLVLRYSIPEEGNDSSLAHLNYFYEVLKMALNKTTDTYGDYEVVPGDMTLRQRDALKSMMKGEGVDVVYTMTDKKRERVLIPVRIPLVKGLSGIRLVLTNKDNKSKFLNVSSLEDLKKMSLIQGHDWPDTEILKYNKLNVVTSEGHQSLFDKTSIKLVDGFPRAVYEIWNEIEMDKELNFATADGFYIYYPTAMYFFVQKSKEGLAIAKRLEAGLREGIADGTFDKLFNKYMKKDLDLAKLNERVGIKLQNPLLPKETPLDNSKLWYLRL